MADGLEGLGADAVVQANPGGDTEESDQGERTAEEAANERAEQVNQAEEAQEEQAVEEAEQAGEAPEGRAEQQDTLQASGIGAQFNAQA